MNVVIILLLTMSFSFADHRGGNGGDPAEIALKGRLYKIAKFISSHPEIFPALYDINWVKIVAPVTIKLTDQRLFDKFGNERDALNFPKKNLIILKKSSMWKLYSSMESLNGFLAHELFNLRGFELPENETSNYHYSEKFLLIPDHKITISEAPTMLAVNCKVEAPSGLQLSAVSYTLIKLKGYQLTDKINEMPEFKMTFTTTSDGRSTVTQARYTDEGIQLLMEAESATMEEALLSLPLCMAL